MSKAQNLERKSFFVDAKALTQAKRLLGARSDAEAIRMALERVAEMERFARFLQKSRGKLAPGSFDPA